MEANAAPKTETKTLGVADLINAAHRAELVRQFEAGEIGEGTITDFDKVTNDSKFYVYTPIDGNEDGMATGYTLDEAKELARKYASEPGNDRGAQVHRISDCEIVWSI